MPAAPLGPTSPIPVIDIAPLWTAQAQAKQEVAQQIAQACQNCGFFYIIGHQVQPELFARMETLSRQFFALPLASKMTIAMEHGGRAWRGYFPLGSELTSGKPDLKEGLYLGAELGPEHPLVKLGLPLHGPNLFPPLPGFRETILNYMDALTAVGHKLMEGIALSLGLASDYFASRYTADPLILFRIFHYPPAEPSRSAEPVWGVGEHTDYGLLTILKQDAVGGLQVKLPAQAQEPARWVDAPVIPNSFVCNIGDMLDRMTAGLYRSTPHRVRNLSGQQRLSFPFFFDPNFQAEVKAIPHGQPRVDDHEQRWDKASVHRFQGTYGDYLLGKVAKVFPQLEQRALKPKA